VESVIASLRAKDTDHVIFVKSKFIPDAVAFSEKFSLWQIQVRMIFHLLVFLVSAGDSESDHEQQTQYEHNVGEPAIVNIETTLQH